jgi:hypothetical protein
MAKTAKIPIADVIAQAKPGSEFFSFNIDFIRGQIIGGNNGVLLLVTEFREDGDRTAIATSMPPEVVEAELRKVLEAMQKARDRRDARRN